MKRLLSIAEVIEKVEENRNKHGMTFNIQAHMTGYNSYKKRFEDGRPFTDDMIKNANTYLEFMRPKLSTAHDLVQITDSRGNPGQARRNCFAYTQGKCRNTGHSCWIAWNANRTACLNETATSGHPPISPAVIKLNTNIDPTIIPPELIDTFIQSSEKDLIEGEIKAENLIASKSLPGITSESWAETKEEIKKVILDDFEEFRKKPAPEIDLVKYGQELCKKIEERDAALAAKSLHIWPDHKPDNRTIPQGRYEVASAPKELHLKGKIHCDEENNLLYLEYAEILDIARYCLRKNATLEITIREEV